jgi:hypothetical protein
MFAHKSVPHLLSQRAVACMAKPLSFHTFTVSGTKKCYVKKPECVRLRLVFSLFAFAVTMTEGNEGPILQNFLGSNLTQDCLFGTSKIQQTEHRMAALVPVIR